MPKWIHTLFKQLSDYPQPWWVGGVLGALAGAVFFFSVPPLDPSESPLLQGFRVALPYVTLVIVLVIVLPAPISAFNSWLKQRRLGPQINIHTIRDLSWQQFEPQVAEAYRRQGYTVVENRHGGPDGCVDIRLEKDNELHLVQCKLWKRKNVGVATVRELYDVMTAEQATSGSIVCSGKYTQDAKNFAHGKSIDFVDGNQLEAMIKKVQPDQPTHEFRQA